MAHDFVPDEGVFDHRRGAPAPRVALSVIRPGRSVPSPFWVSWAASSVVTGITARVFFAGCALAAERLLWLIRSVLIDNGDGCFAKLQIDRMVGWLLPVGKIFEQAADVGRVGR
jgi:hypothetical protein